MKKGNKTKELILHKAITLFAQKGYATVTMKDICDSTGLSRGGLYRHFSSTKDIFIEILNKDIQVNSIAVNEAIKNNIPSLNIFQYYLNQEKDSVFSPLRGFYFAIHEFAFLEHDQKAFFNQRVKNSCEILSRIFKYGQEKDELKKFDIEVVSMHVLYFWDSIKTSSSILNITEQEIDKQIGYLKEMIK